MDRENKSKGLAELLDDFFEIPLFLWAQFRERSVRRRVHRVRVGKVRAIIWQGSLFSRTLLSVSFVSPKTFYLEARHLDDLSEVVKEASAWTKAHESRAKLQP